MSPGDHFIVADDSAKLFVWIASLLATWRQQGQDRLVNEHSPVITERSDGFPENYWLPKRVLCGIVCRRDRWLTDEGEPVVETQYFTKPKY